MKLVQLTHYAGYDEDDFSEFVLKEGTKEEIEPVCKRYAQYLLPVWEGLPLIGFDEKSCTFGSLSKMGYYVRLEIRD